ncbi:MAG: HEAT repeat domain-containing protein [Myxococcaceae bacterium]
MADTRTDVLTPESMLKSALEKIVYFEARSSQLENDYETLRAEADKMRLELSQAAQREIELRRMVAELQVRVQRAHSEREEAGRVTDALRRERAELIGKILEASRINGQKAEGEIDLARFIAELRGEVLSKREDEGSSATSPSGEGARRAGEVSRANPAETSTSTPVTVATELASQGRLQVQVADLQTLAFGQSFKGHTEETLFGFSVRELTAPDPHSRMRAAERLKALGHPAAAPAIAAALHAERDSEVLVALLETFAFFAKAEGVAVVTPLLTSDSPAVRVAALKALLKLDAPQAGPHLAAAVKDPDKAVRRRAALLALSLTGEQALELGRQAVRDPDGEVRALAALVLGASGAEAARPHLLEAMRDTEPKVRRAAAKSLSKLLGREVGHMVDLEDAERRRQVRKLSFVPPQAVDFERVLNAARGATAQKQRVAVLEAPVGPDPKVLDKLMLELRTAIRGRPLNDLAQAVSLPQPQALEACQVLMAKGQIVQRGAKFFVA